MTKKFSVLFLLLVLVVGMNGCRLEEVSDTKNGVNASSDDSKHDGAEDTNTVSIEKVIFERDRFKVTALSLEKDESEPAIKLKLENFSDKDAKFDFSNASINGFMAVYEYESSMVDVKAGSNAETVIAFYQVDLDESGISEIETIEFELSVIDSEGNQLTHEYITISTGIQSNYSYDTSGKTVFNKDGIIIVAQHPDTDVDLGNKIIFYIENNTEKDLSIRDVDGVANNGMMTDAHFSADIAPGKKDVMKMLFNDLQDTINEVEFSLDIMDKNAMETIYTDKIAFTY